MPQPRHFTDPDWPKNMTQKDNLRFWLAYQKQRPLWDFNHKEYSNKQVRKKGFQAIADEMNIPGLNIKNVKLKIRFLRTSYNRWIKRLCLLKETGERFPKIPTWFHIADKFLRDQVRLRKPNNLTETHCLPGKSVNMSGTEAEIYFGSDMPVSSTVEVVEEPAAYVEEEEISPNSRSGKQMNVKSEVVEERLVDNSIYLELDDEQLMAIENGEMSIEDVTARAEAAASQHQQQVARDRSMKAERISLRENARNEEEDDARSRTNEEEEAEDEFDAFGRCVALQLKTLPIDAALELESQIHTLITKKRMVLLRKNKLH